MSGPGSRQVHSPGVVDGAPERPRHFRLHGLLGRGGHGEVYRATMWREGGVQSEVAVKILSPELAPGSDPVRRLEDEGRLLGALDHPVILKVIDLTVLDGRVALVTEFVDGHDLHDAIHGGELPLRGLVEAVGMVADALHVAWATKGADGRPMHLIHRDIKPQNIRLGIHGQVKLLDFGIAQATQLVRHDRDDLLGSGPYLPPERLAQDAVPLTSKVDVWGLGCVLFEGLAGERLMEGRSILDMYALGDDLPAFREFVRQRIGALPVLPRVKGLLAPMLAIDPSERPSAAEIAEACDGLTESVTGTGLLRWARTRKWDTDTIEGPLTSMQLVEGAPSREQPSHGAAPAPLSREPLDLAAAMAEAVTSRPAPLTLPAATSWDAAFGNDISIQPDTVILMDESLRLGPSVTRRPRVHPAWLLLGFGLSVGLLATAIGGWFLLRTTPRALDLPTTTLFGEADDEGLVPEAPRREASANPERAPGEARPVSEAPRREASANPERAPGEAPAKRREAASGELLDRGSAKEPPSPDAPASLRVRGAPVELRGEFGDFRPGTPLVGGDYAVWADFGEGFVDTGLRTRALADGVVTVACSQDKRLCFVRSDPSTSP